MIQANYLLATLLIAALGWGSWIVVILKLSPFTSAGLALGLFYSSLFVALTGTLSLINYWIRVHFTPAVPEGQPLNTALRQGMLLSFMVCIALAFQRLKVLTWWDGILLLAVVLLVEFYFMSRES
jgi:hypothetical protein